MSEETPKHAGDDYAAGMAAALDHVVDDLGARQECADWIFGQLSNGEAAESIVKSLEGNGWTTENAVELVELVRCQTRSERGIVTREDIVRATRRRGSGGAGRKWIAVCGLLVAYALVVDVRGGRLGVLDIVLVMVGVAAATGLFFGIKTFAVLRRARRQKSPDDLSGSTVLEEE